MTQQQGTFLYNTIGPKGMTSIEPILYAKKNSTQIAFSGKYLINYIFIK